jgi:hypothetical protein
VERIENWLKLDIQDRRYISVVRDSQIMSQSSDASKPDSSFSTPPDLAKGAMIAAPLLIPLAPFLLPAAAMAATGYFLHKRTKDSDPPLILKLPAALVKDIDFGPQGWEPDVVYAVNPKQSTMYRPLASFHEELLAHKISELDRFLNALGAREYSIRHLRTRGSNSGGYIGVEPFAKAGGETTSLALCERVWSGTSDGHEPSLPDGLVWYPGERDWQNLADSRFKGTRRQFAFSVRQQESFGVDAELAARVEALNLKIGGRYASTDQIEFAVAGTF